MAESWGVPVRQALYHKDGNFYMILERFPGALFDPDGYVVFQTREEFERSPHLRIGQTRVHVPRGISSMPGYRSKPAV